MKRIPSFLSLIIILLTFNSCNNLKEPKLTSFEKQKVVSDYNWNIISPNGDSYNFIIKQNKVVFVFVWSTKDENIETVLDDLSDLYKEYKTKMEFIFVTKDSQIDVRNFLKSNKYSFPVFFSLSPIPKPMNLEESKKGYLISKKGRVVIEDQGNLNWNSEKIQLVIDGLLKQ